MFSIVSLQAVFSALFVYTLTKYLYRLFFHPLAHIPGPKLAAASLLYNAYYDIFGPGLIKQLPELHKKFGPIVRIQPNEVHVADMEGYTQIFRVGAPFDRLWHDNPFLTGSIQSKTTLPETKKRKEFLNPFFSRAAIQRAEPFLHRRKLDKFLATLDKANGTVVNFFMAFRCLTADTIMDYCFQGDLDALSERDFKSKTVADFTEGFDMAVLPAFFPNVFNVINSIIFALPEKTRREKFAPVYGFQTMQRLSRERVEHAVTQAEKGELVEQDKMPTMFDLMLRPNKEKGQVTPSKTDMVAEGCLMIAAGTDTTAHALECLLWGVTQNPDTEKKLVDSLKKAIPDRNAIVDSTALGNEPQFEYLRATVKEALRLSYGVPGRLPRKVPREGATFNGYFLSAGTVVSSGIYIHNMDPKVFPSPTTFSPERWICDPETYKLRDKQMLSFSRGSRSCVGMNLANAMLNLTTAHMFRRFEIVTTGYTTEKDMEWNDRFVPVANGKIKGMLRVRED